MKWGRALLAAGPCGAFVSWAERIAEQASWAPGAREEMGDRGLSSVKEVGRGLGWNQKKKRVAMGRLGCYLGLGFPFSFPFLFQSKLKPN